MKKLFLFSSLCVILLMNAMAQKKDHGHSHQNQKKHESSTHSPVHQFYCGEAGKVWPGWDGPTYTYKVTLVDVTCFDANVDIGNEEIYFKFIVNDEWKFLDNNGQYWNVEDDLDNNDMNFTQTFNNSYTTEITLNEYEPLVIMLVAAEKDGAVGNDDFDDDNLGKATITFIDHANWNPSNATFNQSSSNVFNIINASYQNTLSTTGNEIYFAVTSNNVAGTTNRKTTFGIKIERTALTNGTNVYNNTQTYAQSEINEHLGTRIIYDYFKSGIFVNDFDKFVACYTGKYDINDIGGNLIGNTINNATYNEENNVYLYTNTTPFSTHDSDNLESDLLGNNDVLEGVMEDDTYNLPFKPKVIWGRGYGMRNSIYTDYDNGGAFFNERNQLVDAALFRDHFWNPDMYNNGAFNIGGSGNLIPNQIVDLLTDGNVLLDLVINLGFELASGQFNGGSSQQKAQMYWDFYVIPTYLNGIENNDAQKIDSAYYYLGRVLHHLQDMSSIPHTHLDGHPPFNPDTFEKTIGQEYIKGVPGNGNDSQDAENSGNPTIIWDYEAFTPKCIDHNDITKYINNDPYRYTPNTSVPAWQAFFGKNAKDEWDSKGMEWNLSEDQLKSVWDSKSPLFHLMYSMAETSDNYPSDEVKGDYFDNPIISLPDNGMPVRVPWLNETTFGVPNWELAGDDIMPKLLSHTAGLYRLFWASVHFPTVITNGEYADYMEDNPLLKPIADKMRTAYLNTFKNSKYETLAVEENFIHIGSPTGDCLVKQHPSGLLQFNNYYRTYNHGGLYYNACSGEVHLIGKHIWEQWLNLEEDTDPSNNLGAPISSQFYVKKLTNTTAEYSVAFENGYITWKGNQSETFYNYKPRIENDLKIEEYQLNIEVASRFCENNMLNAELLVNEVPNGFTVYWVKDGISVHEGQIYTATESGTYTAYISTVKNATSIFNDCRFIQVEEPYTLINNCDCSNPPLAPVIPEPTTIELCQSGTSDNIPGQIVIELEPDSDNLYYWYRLGDLNPFHIGNQIIIASPGIYFVYRFNGCLSEPSNTLTITSGNCANDCNPPITPILSTPTGNTLCQFNTGVPTVTSINASANLPAGYQFSWYKNGVLIANNTSGELLIYPENTTGTGIYTVRMEQLAVNVSCNSAFSNEIEISVLNCDAVCAEAITPYIITENYLICENETTGQNIPNYTLLQTQAVLPPNYHYQWYKNGNALLNEVNPNLLILVDVYGAGEYTLRMISDTDDCISGLSNSIVVSIIDCTTNNILFGCTPPLPPVISSSAATDLCAFVEDGAIQTILGDANNMWYLPSAPTGFYYQWVRNALDIIGENFQTLPVLYTDPGTYAVYLTDGKGCNSFWSNEITITSNCAQGTLCSNPIISSINIIDETCLSLNVTVDENCCPALSEDDFSVFQNGDEQIIYDFLQPGDGGGNRVVDIVFTVDVSGSMDGDINAVKNNMASFLETLESQGGIDYAVGIVIFTEGGTNVWNQGNLYSIDVNASPVYQPILDAINQVNTSLNPNGPPFCQNSGNENSLGGTYNAATLINYRPGSQKIILLLSDEPACEEPGDAILETSIVINDYLIPNNITVYPIFQQGEGDAAYIMIADETNPAGAINGQTYFDNIKGNFDAIAEQIEGNLINTYVITYCSDEFNSTANTQLEVLVKCGIQAFSTSESISSSACPVIQLTAQTSNIVNQLGFEPETEFMIQVNITDNIEPLTTSATLYYSTNGVGSNYSSVAMANVNDNLWEALIPASAAVAPGLNFYITATDGVCSVSDPSVNPTNFPYQIGILNNNKPMVSHNRVFTASVDSDVEVCASVIDNTDFLEEVTLYYRVKPGPGYQTIVMQNTLGGDEYCAIIPAADITCAGVDYYIFALDNQGIATTFGNAGEPNTFFPTLSPTPSSLEATVVSTNQIQLSWIDNSNGTETFIIEKAITTTSVAPFDSEYVIIGSNAEGLTNFTDNLTIEATEVYWYRVRNENACTIGDGTYDEVAIDNVCEALGCGCTDPQACNTDTNAQINNGTCRYDTCSGCTNTTACNYNALATIADDSACDFTSCAGCTDFGACNWNSEATIANNDECDYSCAEIEGCMDASACNFNPLATINSACDFNSCANILGCTNPAACNYNSSATVNDDSCIFNTCMGCTDKLACNFNANATLPDNSCEYISCAGCLDSSACNFNPTATINNNNCDFTTCISIMGCIDSTACNYNPNANQSNNTCEYITCEQITGCSDSSACNYNPLVTTPDNSCEYNSCAGCTNPVACNYDETATIENGSCIYDSCEITKGCKDETACNYNTNANYDDGTCEYYSCNYIPGCTDMDACNYNPNATIPANCNYETCAGCTDINACNYNATATIDSGCEYSTCAIILGCLDETACNFNPNATQSDDSCDFDVCQQILGCTDENACNYNEFATVPDNTCNYETCAGCIDVTACNFEADATISNNNCDYATCNGTEGCTDVNACNYNEYATEDDGSCEFVSCQYVTSCMNVNACNYNSSATNPDNSCEYNSCAGCTDVNACNYDIGAIIIDPAACEYQSCATVLGCTNPTACNFNPNANQDNENCEFNSCQRIPGCRDELACNYNPNATATNSNCDYISCAGCLDVNACNYNSEATINSFSCVYSCDTTGCMDENACNFNEIATEDDGTCEFESCIFIVGCTDELACNYNPLANLFNGTCDYSSCVGCLDENACNYYPNAIINTGCEYSSCIPIMGCTDVQACNFNTLANQNNNTCEYLSCNEIEGCTDVLACNYNASATQPTGSCNYESCSGCVDPLACNFNIIATLDDGSCDYITCNQIEGCVQPGACNFNPSATQDDGTCDFSSCEGCTDSSACNYNSNALISNNSCEYATCVGCTDVHACNYNSNATINNSTCEYISCLGCTDAKACNFNNEASINDGTCEYTSCAGCTDPSACNYDPNVIFSNENCIYVGCEGCTDSSACNYSPAAIINQGCEYDSCLGCTDVTACNYNALATISNTSCDYTSCLGCTDISACNYSPSALINNNSCEYSSCSGCDDPLACNYNAFVNVVDNTLCNYTNCEGCTDPQACNFDIFAKVENGTCEYSSCSGCTDPKACNYMVNASINNGSCEYETCKGCTDINSCNFDNIALIPDDTCEYLNCQGCTDIRACNFSPTAIYNNGGCDYSSCALPNSSGCTDDTACNYNPAAITDNGSCVYNNCNFIYGCTDLLACNFNPAATLNIGSCEYESCIGCTDPLACNYNAIATINNQTCDYQSCLGCMDASACNYDINATTGNRSLCIYDTCTGCLDPSACNYNPEAISENGACEYLSCIGCTVPEACNFDPTASIENGSCEYFSCLGCTDFTACNYNSSAKINNGSCEYESCGGCTNPLACNYDENATLSTNSCTYDGCLGCTDPNACNYDQNAIISNQSCEYNSCKDCLDPLACNYSPAATLSNNNCIYDSCTGCLDINACNYNPTAIISNNTCDYESCGGCTDSNACNFSIEATINDGSCDYDSCFNAGCTDPNACNFNPTATLNNGSCDYITCSGCSDLFACNYNPNASINSELQCNYSSCLGCTDPSACNYNSSALISNNSCEYISCNNLAGCVDPNACNYNFNATFDDNSCEYTSCSGELYGCTDPNACNFNIVATIDDGSCLENDCRGDCGGNYLPNANCNDGNDCTINDKIQQDCTCIGLFYDENENGICDLYEEANALSVPTMSEWGLFILSLLLLNLVFVRIMVSQQQIVHFKNQTAAYFNWFNWRSYPFDATIFFKALIKCLLGLPLMIFTIIFFYQELVWADLFGLSITIPILSYLIHLFMLNNQK